MIKVSLLENLYNYLPGIKKPVKRLTFKQKLIWTGSILLTYYVLSQIPVFGMSRTSLQFFQTYETILGAKIGSLITLGIGPIVTASIILQLLVGSRIIPWDMGLDENRKKFQALQKLLSYLFVAFEAIAFVSMGALAPIKNTPMMFFLVATQVALGGWAIIFMDDVVNKWGFGSGISLFIVAGVSKRIMVRMLSPIRLSGGESFVGIIPEFIRGFSTGNPQFFILIPLLMTIIVFLVAIYAESMRVEIPLTFGNVRGFGRKWPLKFVYTSVLPVILIAALLANVRLLFRMLSSKGTDVVIHGFHLVGDLSSGVPTSNTLVYYMSAPSNFLIHLFTGTVITPEIIRVISYTFIYVVGAVLFSMFWMRAGGQDPETLADQIHGIGMKIPGFRKDKRIIVKILNRYIPALTVLGGGFIGLLAAFANWTNALGSGTGILLAVMIIFQLYEELAKQHMEDMHPALRKFFKSS